MRRVIIMRGLPGSGKSSYISQYHRDSHVCSADNYFTDSSGRYNYNQELIGEAHRHCQMDFEVALSDGSRDVIVDNTNFQKWHYIDYIKQAQTAGLQVVVINLYDGGCTDTLLEMRNKHGVTADKIALMRERWEV